MRKQLGLRAVRAGRLLLLLRVEVEVVVEVAVAGEVEGEANLGSINRSPLSLSSACSPC